MKENNNNNINMENMKKNELKQKSNSYSKKHGPNFKSLINSNGKDTDVNNINSENVNDIKRRIINNLEYAKNKVNKNPNSFNKNHNLRNINDEAGRKYALGKIHKSNFDLSANNRPTNITYVLKYVRIHQKIQQKKKIIIKNQILKKEINYGLIY